MAAVVGRREIMEPAARMFISSTYWSDTIGLRAALKLCRKPAQECFSTTLEVWCRAEKFSEYRSNLLWTLR